MPFADVEPPGGVSYLFGSPVRGAVYELTSRHLAWPAAGQVRQQCVFEPFKYPLVAGRIATSAGEQGGQTLADSSPQVGYRYGPVDEVTHWDSWGSGPNGPLPGTS